MDPLEILFKALDASASNIAYFLGGVILTLICLEKYYKFFSKLDELRDLMREVQEHLDKDEERMKIEEIKRELDSAKKNNPYY